MLRQKHLVHIPTVARCGADFVLPICLWGIVRRDEPIALKLFLPGLSRLLVSLAIRLIVSHEHCILGRLRIIPSLLYIVDSWIAITIAQSLTMMLSVLLR